MGFILKLCTTLCLIGAVDLSYSAKIRHLSHLSRSFPFLIHANPCDGFACYPPSGNLLIGRQNKLSASSTCGLGGEERYCVSYGQNDRKCFRCDSRPQYSQSSVLNHRITQAVPMDHLKTLNRGWWQAENGVENVTVQLDLESMFDMAHIILTFKSYRPKAMFIEKSLDFGTTWTVSGYFAQNCSSAFPGIPIRSSRVTEAICTTRYSSRLPAAEGELIYSVFSSRIPIADPKAEEIQNLMKTTNIRLRFTKLHTLNGEDPSGEHKENYYHTLRQLIVLGRCRCNGHAAKCIYNPKFGNQQQMNMVYPTCQCAHNTKGDHCEMCDDEYNFQWKPSEAEVCKNVE